ncbi:MAG: acetyl-CoA carboxylase biotin carboxylase subunit [Brevinemataceae bacterium]
MKFNRILIANRGEIAVRIIRAAKELGIETVAVYSQADADALHTKLADLNICIGPASSSESYLNMSALVSAALISESQAIHPGYGFFSENARFADVCRKHNIVFIGPSPEAISLLGNKTEARETMKTAGIPITPGTGVIKDVDEAKIFAKEAGYPIIIKAASGGGGKGMRVVWNDHELAEQLPIASSEAEVNFGNSDVYLEKFHENPRHIEVQFIGDSFGNVVHLMERDCSVQRRHQKLIEEAPSPELTPEQRQELGDICVKGIKSVGYTGAGTMEFLYDPKTKKFYFMEVNTRIQVEHCVTEMVTGIDLVKEQILVAQGHKLSFTQDDISLLGHAIECRINAEDPFRDFIPTPGKLESVHFPGGPGTRIDSHAYSGCMIPQYYDSLIAKVIALGRDREEALDRMQRILDELVILGKGVKTTIPFHKQVMKDPVFRSGKFTTKFLENFTLEE